jgi:hypothetical protein
MATVNNKIILDVDADYNGDNLVEFCELLVKEIKEYRLESHDYDINDPFVDYLQGSVAAREVILSRLGYPSEFYSDGSC